MVESTKFNKLKEDETGYKSVTQFIENNKLKMQVYSLVPKSKGGDFYTKWRNLPNDQKNVIIKWYNDHEGNVVEMKKYIEGRPEFEQSQLGKQEQQQEEYGEEDLSTFDINNDIKKLQKEVKEVQSLEQKLEQQKSEDSVSSKSQKQLSQKTQKSEDNGSSKSQKQLSQKIQSLEDKIEQIKEKSLSKKQQQSLQQLEDDVLSLKSVQMGSIIHSKLDSQLKKSHPKSMQLISSMFDAGFSDSFKQLPVGIITNADWFKINKRREKVYENVKQNEQQQLLTQTEKSKLLYKEATRNGGQNGANLAVIENQHGVEEYRVKYPTIDQMLNSKVVDQFAFDLAQKRNLTMVQTDLLKTILHSGGSIVVPNLEFLRQEYTNKQSRGEDYSKEFEKYQQQIIKQIGTQVAYNGEQDWSQLKDTQNGKASSNFSAPALQTKLQKPKMIETKQVLQGIDQMVDYISKLSGNLNQTNLKKYAQVDDVFSSMAVQRQEPTTFKPQPGMAFKLRELMC